jgi:hypothetical protein
MFTLFRSNPTAKLEKQYDRLLKQGMEAQRSGDIRLYSELSKQADEVLKSIDKIKENEGQN